MITVAKGLKRKLFHIQITVGDPVLQQVAKSEYLGLDLNEYLCPKKPQTTLLEIAKNGAGYTDSKLHILNRDTPSLRPKPCLMRAFEVSQIKVQKPLVAYLLVTLCK